MMPLLLVSGATVSAAPYLHEIGRLVVPRSGDRPEKLQLRPGRWAMDNGAYAGFDVRRFMRMLEIFAAVPGCLFVACPDAVGDAQTTLAQWPFWSRVVRGAGFPVALVAQDGMTVAQIPWPELSALFIGGTTEWKLGPGARTLAAYAKARGLWLHVGRVNSERRLRYVMMLGADSFDGTKFSRWGREEIPRRLASFRRIRQQPLLQGIRF